ncbi:MAG: beta strand repeat-containing protein [Promethearchaeota archaeon]
MKIDFDFGATPQRGTTGYPLNGYTNDTGVYFKNYGDWPHLMQFVSADDTQPTKQDMKSWYGSKYGYFQEYIDARRRDYPLEPWTAWWDNDTGSASDPTIGMFAITEGVGWEVLSLAVNGIGNNSLLQQILPEGHQGDQFLLTNGTVLSYDYYMLTSPYGTNDSIVRDVAKRMNVPIFVEVGPEELFSNNGLFIHTNDITGTDALGLTVRLYNSTMDMIREEVVNSIGNVSLLQLPDDTYTVNVVLFTPYTVQEYVVATETFELDHLVNRTTYRTYNCNVANLTVTVVNWARSNETLNGAQIKILNSSTSADIEENIALTGVMDFRLYTDGTTDYDIEIWYGGFSRTMNITNPFTLTTNDAIDIAVQVETTAITIDSQNNPINFEDEASLEFYFHKSSDFLEQYGVEEVAVSTNYDSDYWTLGIDYTWADVGGGLTQVNMSSGVGTRLNETGIQIVYLHASNQTVESSTEKVFIIINDMGAYINKTINDTSVTQVQTYRGDAIVLEVDYIDARNHSDITDATVNYTIDGTEYTIPYNGGSQNYSVTIDTTGLSFDSHLVTITANRTNYETQITSIIIVVMEKPTSLSLNSPGTVTYGENLTIVATYRDAVTNNPINIPLSNVDSSIDGSPAVPVISSISPGVFNITYDTWDLPALGDYNVTVTCDYTAGIPNYVNQSQSTTITLQNRLTQLYTTNTFGDKTWGSNFTVNAFFVDLGNGTSIDNSSGYLSIDISCAERPTVNSTSVGISFNGISETWELEFDPSTFLNPRVTQYDLVLDFNWSVSGAPYYVNQTVTFGITITAAPTRLTLLPGDQTQIAGNYHELTFFFSNEATGDGISLTDDGETLQQNINISTTHAGFNSTIYDPANNLTTNGTAGYFSVAINITEWSETNIHAFNISIDVDNYNSIVNYSFSLILIPKYTILETEAITSGHLEQDINITLFYHLQSTSTAIEPDTVLVSTNESSGYWTAGVDFNWMYDAGSERVIVTVHTGLVGTVINSAGTHSFFINVSAPTYESQRVRTIISLNTIPTNISTVMIDASNETGPLPTAIVYIGDTTQLDIYYEDIFNTLPVTDGSVTITLGAWSDVLVWDASSGYYNLTLNTNVFGTGPATFTIVATKGNYTQSSIQVKLDIQSVTTDLIHYLEGVNNASIEVYYGQNVTVSAIYNDTHNIANITNSGVSLSLTGGASPITTFVLVGDYWVANINSTAIGVPGTYSMTLSAGLTDYQTGITTFVISILQIPTELIAYNDTGTLQNAYDVYWGENVSLALLFNNTVTGTPITGANVGPGSGYTYDSSVTGYWYNFTFNTSSFGDPNVYTITMSGSLVNHISSSTTVTINVAPLTTELRVYQSGTLNNTVDQYYSSNFTVDLVLYDTVNGENVSGVSFSYANGSAVPVTGGPVLYSFERNTSSLGDVGIYQFTVTATKTNYVIDSEVITVNVMAIATQISVYINGTDRTASLQESIDFQESINLTVYFNNTFGAPVNNANLSFTFDNGTITTYNMVEFGTSGNYSIVLDSDDLGSGPQYVFMFSADKPNHETIFARINIFLNAIPTALNITYNSTQIPRSGENNTISAVYTDVLTFGIDFISYLQADLHLDDTATGIKIAAIINEQEVLATWSAINSSWILVIDTSNPILGLAAGLTHQVLVIGEADGYQGDNFNVLLSIQVIPTNISVLVNGVDASIFSGSTLYLDETIDIRVYYQQDYGAMAQLASQPGASASVSYINKSTQQQVVPLSNPPATDYFSDPSFLIDRSSMKTGIVTLYISAQFANHAGQQETITVNIQYRPATFNVTVNGMNSSALITQGVFIGNEIDVSVNLEDQLNSTALAGASVFMVYSNDWVGSLVNVSLPWNVSSGTFDLYDYPISIDNLKSNEFGKRFQFSFFLAAYENSTVDVDIKIKKIFLNIELDVPGTLGDNVIERTPKAILNLTLRLYDAATNLSYTVIENITIRASLQGVDYNMVADNTTGTFYVLIECPSRIANYTIYIDIQITDTNRTRELIEFETRTFTYTLNIVKTGDTIPIWVFYMLIGIIIGISVWFILYQIRFKYPPLIRKIQDLRRVVSRGKASEKIKPPKVRTREENIYAHYSGQINTFSFLQTKDSRFAAKSAGYAPTPDSSIELEFGMPSIDLEKAEQVGPKTLKKGMVLPKPAAKPPAPPIATPGEKGPAPSLKPAKKPAKKPAIAQKPLKQPAKPAAPKLVAKRPSLIKPSLKKLPTPKKAPLKAVRTTPAAKPGIVKPASHENLYQQLVLLEQKRYKAERSMRDLTAKHSKGLVSDDEFNQYKAKLDATLGKIKSQISDIRRRLISI